MSANRARDSRETVRRKRRERTKENLEFYECIRDIVSHPAVLEMKKYYQHCDTDCYEHCLDVAYNNYKICKKLGLDARSAARGGMLHDLFLYDWREHSKKTGDRLEYSIQGPKNLHMQKKPSPIQSLPIEMPANIFI